MALTQVRGSVSGIEEDLASLAVDDGTLGFNLVSYSPVVGEVGVINGQYIHGDLRRYGAVGDGIADDTVAIQNALLYAQLDNGVCYIPIGVYRFTSALVVSAPCVIRGEHNGYVSNNGTGSVLMKVGNFDGLTLQGGSVMELDQFILDSAGGVDNSRGLVIQSVVRSRFTNINVVNHGADGIAMIAGDQSSFRDVYSINNDGNGLSVFNGSYLKGNITTEFNTGRGVYIENSFGSELNVFTTGNAIGIQLSSSVSCRSNKIFVAFGNSGDNLIDDGFGNEVITSRRGGDIRLLSNKVHAQRFEIPNVGNAGSLRMEKSAAGGIYNMYMDEHANTSHLVFKNVEGLADPINDSAIHPAVLQLSGAVIRRTPYSFAGGDTAPDVSMSEFWIANNPGTTVITHFVGGQVGQLVSVVGGNLGTTIIEHSPAGGAGPGIVMRAGFNATFLDEVIKIFMKVSTDRWIEI